MKHSKFLFLLWFFARHDVFDGRGFCGILEEIVDKTNRFFDCAPATAGAVRMQIAQSQGILLYAVLSVFKKTVESFIKITVQYNWKDRRYKCHFPR